MATPLEVVSQFIDTWPSGDAHALAAFFTEDAVYHNIPVDPVVGRDAIESMISWFTEGVDKVEFEVRHAVADGPVVMTERIDRFFRPAGVIALPVMGIFEVQADGLISGWRDYFDLNQFMTQLGEQG